MLFFLFACHQPDLKDSSAPTEGISDSEPCLETEWYRDADADGLGDGAAEAACAAPEGFVATAGDCDDADAAVLPGATEACDGIDQDCDGEIDEGFPAAAGWADADGDTFGDPATPNTACTLPDGWVENADDCDDADGAVFPGAPEYCNGYDDDCDALVDDADSPVYGVGTSWADDDGDGYGDEASPLTGCSAPAGYVTDADVPGNADCDDADVDVNPGAAEVCLDGVDQDCDGFSDDYSGICAPVAPASNRIRQCGSDVPVDVALCVAGVAALLPSGATYGTVQGAMDAALSGEVVSVCPGVWSERLTQRVSPLTLSGYGTGVSVIDGGGAGRVLTMGAGGTLTVLDLDLEGGASGDGGAIQGSNASLCVARSGLSLNSASSGGAISLGGTGTLTMDEVTLYGNTASSDGGALYVSGAYTVAVEDSLFMGNFSGYSAGGASIDSVSTAGFTNTTFLENDASYTGGALTYGGWGPALTLTLDTVTFDANTSGYEGGALTIGSWDYPTVDAIGTVFSNNYSAYEGGAVELNSWGGGVFEAVASTFTNNGSLAGGAISLHAWGTPSTSLEACVFDANYATSGAALDLNPVGSTGTADATIVDSTFTSNVGTAGRCGAVSIDTAGATLQSTSSDWGAGATDNAPDDICGYTYGAAASFTCTGGACR